MKNTMQGTTKSLHPEDRHFEAILKHAVAPRPICFASTQDKEGNVNLSPFSYFNMVSQNPAILLFSPLRRMRNSTIKHTLENLYEVPEVVINIVNYPMVQQQSLASTEYEKGVNEFVKAGFTPIASELIAPPRVAESPVQLECRVREIIPLGDTPGSGNLVLSEVLRMHIRANMLDAQGYIQQGALDLVARLGANWYCRVRDADLFEVAKPLATKGIGVDQLPEKIRLSTVLTGNHLGQLANVEQIPEEESLNELKQDPQLSLWLKDLSDKTENLEVSLHQKAALCLDKGQVMPAWRILRAIH